MASPITFKRSPSRNQQRVSLTESSQTPESLSRRRSKYLDSKFWRPYQNSAALAQQLYDLTHPDEATFAELAREADLSRELEPYQKAVVRLSELLT
ncbi:MAG: hypothetical protein WA947_08255 [Phormidesmis sp.]